MADRRLRRLHLALILVGIGIAAFWAVLIGGSEALVRIARGRPAYCVPLLGCTVASVVVRFVRWQFLLRSVSVRVPTKPSLRVFLASLAGVVTPAYVGEVVRAVFLRRRFGTPMRATAWMLVIERVFDVTALGALGVWLANSPWTRLALLALIGISWAVGLLGGTLVRGAGQPVAAVAGLREFRTIAFAFALTVAAWVPPLATFTLAAAALDLSVPLHHSARIFSEATLFGGATLMPAGFGATGSFAILRLGDLGIALAPAILLVSLVRASTTGITLAVSFVFLAAELRIPHRRAAFDAGAHFDEIAPAYGEQFSTHVWDHLLRRKIERIVQALPAPAEAGLGLDLGCGLGIQSQAMRRQGFQVIGVDASLGLLKRGISQGLVAANASVLALPFDEGTLDFVFAVGVLHHLGNVEQQEAAAHEVLRVLKPGGLFIIHESNTRNPLFRFYMGYVFPILKSIDEGTEWWIDPRRWTRVPGARLESLEYFTFIPDFVPRTGFHWFRQLEATLESSRLRAYSVHYVATLRKVSAP